MVRRLWFVLSAMFHQPHFLTTALGSAFAGVGSTFTAPLIGQESKLSYKGENLHDGLVTYMWGAEWIGRH